MFSLGGVGVRTAGCFGSTHISCCAGFQSCGLRSVMQPWIAVQHSHAMFGNPGQAQHWACSSIGLGSLLGSGLKCQQPATFGGQASAASDVWTAVLPFAIVVCGVQRKRCLSLLQLALLLEGCVQLGVWGWLGGALHGSQFD